MFKFLATSLLLAGLLATSPSHAQVGARAYAPENISQLSVSDQVRVIENEYRDQSRGRSIPDDQLDFYLDQIRYSRWTFSRIQSDISTSLRGNSNWRPPGSGWNQREVICTSINNRYRECRTPYNGPARITQQMSSTRCVEGRNWGSRPGLIWVDQGCRARFAENTTGWPSWGSGGGQREITCESENERYRQCNTGFRGQARLVRQLSKDACIEGRSWGQARGMVWVSRGCRARFEDTGWAGGNNNYPGDNSDTVTCASTDDRRRQCPWNERWGRPRLIQQISKSPCIEGRSWGYSYNAIWVDDGCRGRFGAR
jgi:hypothetical protein